MFVTDDSSDATRDGVYIGEGGKQLRGAGGLAEVPRKGGEDAHPFLTARASGLVDAH